MTIRREKTSRVLELEELEENIEAMSPAASRLLKSGMTLTQIYSQYVSISEQMLFEEEENKKLNNYIDQILQEHEDRAPTIARQREDSILKEKKEKEAALDSQIQALQGQLAELRAIDGFDKETEGCDVPTIPVESLNVISYMLYVACYK
ncbi:nucleoprotein TPR-like [Daphnia pulex]|uniref:nucleoprotein TPR-like n=1 Tax=Daphnia pulex TaxID=6669 RepID=UPI001EE14997|nr:nucleoprotein TPR-like [Daphnia pulex]